MCLILTRVAGESSRSCWCTTPIRCAVSSRANTRKRLRRSHSCGARSADETMDASLLAGWENFYVITGSSAGGLTGITFVVIALIRDVQRVRPTGLRAFVTPTIVHFSGVLALAAYLSMPHQGVTSLSIGFGIAGLVGLIYGGVIAANMRRQGSVYVPVHEDWIWNVALP